MKLLSLTILSLFVTVIVADLPTNYEYYTLDGIESGLSADQPYFILNGKNISIYSGALHYFRVPRAYWRDRLRKFRAAGLNAVETYVPWNLHEYQDGKYDFGDAGTDMEDFLHIEEFLKTAQEEDLFVIARPGPFICAEWEFGGLPSWILRNNATKVRTSEETYIAYVTRYFNVLLPIFAKYQFTKGGPIIMYQIENEYANTQTSTFTPDKEYLKILTQLYLENGINELLVTSDGSSKGWIGSLENVLLPTANFGDNPESNLQDLEKYNPNHAKLGMEVYTGWYDHWGAQHNTRDVNVYRDLVEGILSYPASFNHYMFIGGTNFGFLNGANSGSTNADLTPVTNSYDYDSPIVENGDYTEKYNVLKELLDKYNPIKTKLPDQPELIERVAYPTVEIKEQILMKDIIDGAEKYQSKELIPMEFLPINNASGQSYGFIVYRKTLDIPANAVLKIGGYVYDSVLVLVNGVMLNTPPKTVEDLDGFGFWKRKDSEITLTAEDIKNATLDLIVENMGRNNFGSLDMFFQFKGLWEDKVYINDQPLEDWEIIPLEFRTSWTNSLDSWNEVKQLTGPALYKGTFEVTDLRDSYVDLRNWTKGIVIVNGFVLSRHFLIGPQLTAYLPASLLKNGTNTIVIFEEFSGSNEVNFSKDPLYGSVN